MRRRNDARPFFGALRPDGALLAELGCCVLHCERMTVTPGPWVPSVNLQCHFHHCRMTPQPTYCVRFPPQSPYTCIADAAAAGNDPNVLDVDSHGSRTTDQRLLKSGFKGDGSSQRLAGYAGPGPGRGFVYCLSRRVDRGRFQLISALGAARSGGDRRADGISTSRDEMSRLCPREEDSR